MYDLLQLIISKLKCEIQYEINEVIATDKTLVLIGMNWRMIDDLITNAWGIVSRRPAAYYDRLNLTDNPPVQAPTNHAAIHHQVNSHCIAYAHRANLCSFCTRAA